MKIAHTLKDIFENYIRTKKSNAINIDSSYNTRQQLDGRKYCIWSFVVSNRSTEASYMANLVHPLLMYEQCVNYTFFAPSNRVDQRHFLASVCVSPSRLMRSISGCGWTKETSTPNFEWISLIYSSMCVQSERSTITTINSEYCDWYAHHHIQRSNANTMCGHSRTPARECGVIRYRRESSLCSCGATRVLHRLPLVVLRRIYRRNWISARIRCLAIRRSLFTFMHFDVWCVHTNTLLWWRTLFNCQSHARKVHSGTVFIETHT